ncbi:DMT family transporter [Paenibacillus marchantiophytorum]|uniref:DMT family transporter n=1 Tax=Paenibacillus marchantiophytorum TaxID=1619310 RepID=UPI00166D2BA1|nr:DMT family transporter [Paenibacillus marchantiophytorum]
MNRQKAEWLMIAVTLCWGSSYLFMQYGLNAIDEFNLIALRFGFAFLVTAGLFFKHLRRTNLSTIKYGAYLGFLLFCIFTCITFGLKTTTTSNAGFLVSLTVIFVPFIYVLVCKRKPHPSLIVGVSLAFIGMGLLTLNSQLRIYPGDFLCILSALFYAVYIILTRTAAKKVDSLNLGIWQLGFAGALGLLFSFIFETPSLPATLNGWISILVLSLVCSAFGFVVQPLVRRLSFSVSSYLIGNPS